MLEGSGAINITGTLTLSAGTFTATSGTLKIYGTQNATKTIFDLASGVTFNHNNGTFIFGTQGTGYYGNYTHTINLDATLALYNATIKGGSSQPSYGDLDVKIAGSAAQITVANDLTITTDASRYRFNLFAGNIDVTGNITCSGTGTIGGHNCRWVFREHNSYL